MDKPFILIAEDDADDRYLLRAAFHEKGFKEKIEFVENGLDLLEFLHSIEPNNDTGAGYPGFVMLDLNMPKKDGREVLKEIKQHPEFRQIPVIVFTTTKNENEVRRCYQLGANTYIVKPVSFEGLLKVVDDLRSYWFSTASIPG
jgi:CheY-like chemotaxis protein